MAEQQVNWLMTLDEVAVYFKVSVQSVRRWIHVGELAAVRVPSEKRDLNPDPDPTKPKTKWRPATESQSTLYVTWEALMTKARVFYKIEENKK